MIIYPGIDEKMREYLRLWESLTDSRIDALEPEKRATVSEACASCGLDGDGTRSVLSATCHLIEFERHGRDRVLTDAERFEIIEYIRDTSYSLAMAMEDLDSSLTMDGWELHRSFNEVTGELDELRRLKLEGSRPPDALTLAVLAQAADRMLTSKGGLQGKGGRRGLRVHYIRRCIAPLAETFDKYGLPVGRGGAFERLCNVVFEVAGVRATAEGAIRYYLSERKECTQNGPENSGKEAAE